MPGTAPDPVTQISEAEKVCSWTSHLVFLQINNSLSSFHRVRSAVEKESRETVMCRGRHLSRAGALRGDSNDGKGPTNEAWRKMVQGRGTSLAASGGSV